MTYQISDLSATRKACTIDFPKAELASKYQKQLHSFKSKAQVPGFRKGHTPLAMIERQYSGAIIQEILDEKIQECWTQVCKTDGIEVLERPSVDVSPKISSVQDLKSDLTLTLSFDVAPKFTLVAPQDIKAQIQPALAYDETITSEKRANYRTILEIECGEKELSDAPASRDDQVTLCVTYLNTGKKEDDLVLVLHPDQTQEEFIAQVEGMAVNEERTFDYTPSDYTDSQVSEKVTVTVLLKSVSKIIRASAQKLCDSIPDLKGTPEDIQEEKIGQWIDTTLTHIGAQERYRKNDQILRQALLNFYNFEVPSVHLRGKQFDSVAKQQKAENSVRLNYIFGAYSETMTLSLSEEEVDMFMKMFAQDLGLPIQYMSMMLQYNKDLAKNFQETLAEKVLVKRLLEACGLSFATGFVASQDGDSEDLLHLDPVHEDAAVEHNHHDHDHAHCSSHCSHEH